MGYAILIVEDDHDINHLLKMHLEKEGYQVDQAFDGAEAVHLIQVNQYDLYILDYMLPYVNGMTILARIRAGSVAPVLFLTARTDEADKIEAFTMGADDYIEKPFSPIEVVHRVQASLRRYLQYQAPKDSRIYENGDLKLYPDKFTVYRGSEAIPLNLKAFKLLELFMSAPGRIFTKEQIYQHVWEGDYLLDSNTLMVHISQVRDKIEPNPKSPIYIKTIKCLGYRMEKHDKK